MRFFSRTWEMYTSGLARFAGIDLDVTFALGRYGIIYNVLG